MIPRDRAPRLAILVSTAEIGGAEASLLSEAGAEAASGYTPFFLVPSEGPFAEAARASGWAARTLPWPAGFASLTQTRWRAMPALPGIPAYLFRLYRELRGAEHVWSSGAKSHAACLPLSPWLGPRLMFDVRDFLRAPVLRRALAVASRRFGCAIRANSRAVAADYPGAEVRYPRVSLARPAADRRARDGRRVVTHLAYFAPYKGQDLFLRCARALIDAGADAEFRLIGDVIYPAPAYARYRDSVLALASELGLADKVRFLGRLSPEEVQRHLEETHLLLHCTREPEPFGRAPMEALLCGCEVIVRKGSGICEAAEIRSAFPGWAGALRGLLGADFVALAPRPTVS